MPIKDLRQDTLKPLPYFGANNAQCIYWDRQLPGFGVRVFPSGRRMFVCSYRVQGRKRLATLGRGDVLRLEVARKKAVSYLGQVAEGVDPQAPKETIKAAGTVKSLAEIYPSACEAQKKHLGRGRILPRPTSDSPIRSATRADNYHR